ncbi:MAG: hypothetical protein A4E47_00145 [Methanosaeta sp. PtaU1.Bin028]|nr:MAG: hypothetical protein A4E47_00145 [Methanosaeta sp. PtaU1.Bin028]
MDDAMNEDDIACLKGIIEGIQGITDANCKEPDDCATHAQARLQI